MSGKHLKSHAGSFSKQFGALPTHQVGTLFIQMEIRTMPT